ncbi:ribosome silencing factor [Umezakia ovalisporum]|jgi:ribosome-associated protein|uniref:Ribosomal silencing factor RsfS n=2 Tax=Umezakia ovalisporum TaxID=75695 RepID=A0AA43GV51_9CYAN|nr:ribosome silencing factor [Umezakia ovalisporum]MBI1241731.1 ribosome silencing factor [Nostoc sp. RI_552]MDH6056578.1 ribosome silencing factor [Umezakia ovalisporum FSS-43]MDH6062331.1 ribosome silencing factor [Umezakia ovalisporum FSS-62]MDH6067928.1 ribosome silencing factor [Umezakia ovalisporum APH033B]MDH6069238.1 ribosome silencing factor [Umezakia ovalisporum CobakiLakeA]
MSDYFQGNFPLQSVSEIKSALRGLEAEAKEVSKDLALTIAEAALDRKAGDILVLGVADVSYLADYFVMMTGYSRVQVRAIADAIEARVESDWQRRPLQIEGKADSSWVLLDYGEVIVHIMMPTEREFYNLEAFWVHAERISLANSDEGGGKVK